MVAKLRLILTDGIYEFRTNDFGRAIPFKIYKEDDMFFDFTGYTVVIKGLDDTQTQMLSDITPTSTTPGSGTGTFKLTSDNTFTTEGFVFIEAELTKSGEKESAITPTCTVSRSP